MTEVLSRNVSRCRVCMSFGNSVGFVAVLLSCVGACTEQIPRAKWFASDAPAPEGVDIPDSGTAMGDASAGPQGQWQGNACSAVLTQGGLCLGSTKAIAMSAADCKAYCKCHPDMQKTLACPAKREDGTCLDLSAGAPTCAPFSGPCVCDLVDAGVQCLVCGDSLQLDIPSAVFQDVQVISAFPAVVTGDTIERVCGVPGAGAAAAVPNGIEFTVAMVSSSRLQDACQGDRDLSVKDGDRIDFTRVIAEASDATVAPGDFKLHLDCLEPHQLVNGDDACSTSVADVDAFAAGVHYRKVADRCDPNRDDTHLNVAVLVDHSGSVSGLVDANTLVEEAPASVKLPNNIGPEVKSDPFNARIAAASTFLDSLNDTDRAIAYYFDEQSATGVSVACSDSRACMGGDKDGKPCMTAEDCPGGDCYDDLSMANDTFEQQPFKGAGVNQQNHCFGPLASKVGYMKLGLDIKAKLQGEGRAPLWQGVQEAYSFLTGTTADGNAGVSRNRSIVVLTDGPDTCTDSEDFNYKDLTGSGKCRVPCANAQIDYQALRTEMDHDGWPVQLHFVQFQSPAHKAPDARMQELACRSGGTYQFVNSENFNKSNPTDYTTLRTAMLRVRNVLSGSWRVGFTHSAMGAGDIVAAGSMMAAQGSMQFVNPKFASLDAAYKSANSWRFGFTGQLDRRLLFRRACAASTDCGGNAECAANWCTGGGLCQVAPAQDKLPCSKGKCCSGACTAKCDTCN